MCMVLLYADIKKQESKKYRSTPTSLRISVVLILGNIVKPVTIQKTQSRLPPAALAKATVILLCTWV